MNTSTEVITQDAATDPALLFSSSVNESEDSTRETGLILTKDQIKNIKRYEIAALALPITLTNVQAYLGYTGGAGRGLEPGDFLKTFTLINGHASLWNPLRIDLLTVSDRLMVFARSMTVYSKSMTEIFDDIRALSLVEKYEIKTLEDLRKVENSLGEKFPDIEKADREDLGFFLDKILVSVREREAEAIAIKERLDSFGKVLANRVAPDIKLKLAAIDNNTLGEEVKALQVRIDDRAKSIEELNAEYKKMVEEAIRSALGNIIMMIYASVKAEEIRKNRNELRKAQESDIALMEKKNKILASLGRVRMNLQDLDIIVIDADIATKNLITVWNKLATFISASSAEVDGIHDGLSMRRFKNQFNLVVEPWGSIEKDAYALLSVFAEADREFREEYGV